MTREYPVVYEWTGKNFSGYAPDVPGCVATARTLPLMRSALKGALGAHLQWLAGDGDRIPPASESVVVDMEQDKQFPHPCGYYVVVEKLAVAVPKSKPVKRRPARIKRATPKRRALVAA
jgi:predicted RNase H-like HicB family nuclease